MKCQFVSVLLLTLLPIAWTHAEFANIDEALKAAQARQQPVFVDFSAIWCHSCHAMDDQVLNGADWDSRLTRMVLVRSDADGENGDAWMKKLKMHSLPTYAVLNPDGSERGRLVGEMKRAEFYPALDRLLDGSDGVDQLKAQAAKGSAEAVVKVLRAYDERDEAPAGIRWYASLPDATRKAVEGDAGTATQHHVAEMNADKAAISERMRSQRKQGNIKPAANAGQDQSCRNHAQQALAGTLTVDERVEVTRTLIFCSEDLSPEKKKVQALTQLAAVQALYDKEVPNGGSGLLREVTHLLAGIYRVLGDDSKVKATYERAVAIGRKALDDGHGGLDVKRDRSMNLVLGEMMYFAKLKDKRVALDKAMVEAYPDDYHCADAYGEDLLDAGKAAEALPYLDRAAKKAVGLSRLSIAYHYAKVLVALNRRAEGIKIYNEALREGEKAFPEYTAIVKKTQKL